MNSRQQEFSFDELPDSSRTNLEEGQHKLTVVDAKKLYAKTGALMMQFFYIIDDNSKLKLNYDNCVIIDKDGQKVPLGSNKLKKIMKATGVTPARFTLDTLSPLLIGKSFLVNLTKNEKGYLVIDPSNLDTIRPVVENTNEEVIISQKEEKTPIDFVEDNDLDWN